MDAYAAFLRTRGVDTVLPLHELLRTGRRWQRCSAEEFGLPPRAHWPAMVPTLRLVAALHAEGLLPDATAASVYRDAGFNACEGGSPQSRHMRNSALDFDLAPTPDGVHRLCAFWREQGAQHHFGLGFYGPAQIHVDSSGHRTWGGDYTRRSSLCAQRATQ